MAEPRQRADFTKRTFLERVSLAAREPVYSAAFAWALEDRSPLPLTQRLAVVAALSGAEIADGRSIRATTEWNDLDLLLTIERTSGPTHVAIENKIKAVDGWQQLAAYDEPLALLPGTVKKVFLTLTGEAPRSGVMWSPASYAMVLDALLTPPPSASPYVSDLCDALGRLVAVADAARSDESAVAAAAFEDATSDSDAEIGAYVEEMRLEKVVQRIWMTALAADLEVKAPWRASIDETRGQALLNVEAGLRDRPGFLVGMQLQWRALKAFCVPYPYPKVATDEQHRTIEASMETIRSALGLGRGVAPSSPRNRGFRSFTVATLPPGRRRREWAAVVRPHLAALAAAFPSVQPVMATAVPAGVGA